jgi:hypothetical protein
MKESPSALSKTGGGVHFMDGTIDLGYNNQGQRADISAYDIQG